ncbi:MAG: hypothetical protein FWG67_00890 [Defluviitaleaceae bacterium]|nr:hypothetical protein [Defluviitaleaceae bacterium]
MFERKRPIFTKGRILKNEMLETMRDFPTQVMDIWLASQGDGVVCGLDLTVDAAMITLAAGMVKHEGELLVLVDALQVPYVADGREQFLKLQFHDRYETADFEGRQVEVVLHHEKVQSHEMELARFRLSQGAYLRQDYQDFEDFKTGHNTLNVVNQPYSSVSGVTLNPMILRYFAHGLLSYQTENPHDLAVVYQVLNGTGSMSKELLVHYIKIRLKEAQAQIETNDDLFKGLLHVLKLAKREVRGIGRTVSGSRRLIVD